MSQLQRTMYWLGGALAVATAIAGVFLPILPTTPFLLLASYCFMRSSPEWHRWLLNHPWLGPFLWDWEQRRGVRRSVKVLAVATVVLVFGATLAIGRPPLWLAACLVSLGGIGLLVLWRLPVVSEPSTAASLDVIAAESGTSEPSR